MGGAGRLMLWHWTPLSPEPAGGREKKIRISLRNITILLRTRHTLYRIYSTKQYPFNTTHWGTGATSSPQAGEAGRQCTLSPPWRGSPGVIRPGRLSYRHFMIARPNMGTRRVSSHASGTISCLRNGRDTIKASGVRSLCAILKLVLQQAIIIKGKSKKIRKK